MAPARAQVNVEPLRSQLEERGAVFRARWSLTGRTGNTQEVTLGGGGLVGFSRDRSLGYLALSGDYSKVNGTTKIAKSFGHARYNYEIVPWLWGEAFAQVESDRFRRIAARELLGVGPRFELLPESESVRVFVGTSYMLELTQRDDSTVSAADRRVTAHRWNNYVAVTFEVHERITFTNTIYYQPRFDDFGDVRVLDVVGVRFEITDVLSSHVDATVRHESRVPRGVDETDTELVSSLAVTF